MRLTFKTLHRNPREVAEEVVMLLRRQAAAVVVVVVEKVKQ